MRKTNLLLRKFCYFSLFYQRTIYLKPVFLQGRAQFRSEALSNYDKAASLLLRSPQKNLGSSRGIFLENFAPGLFVVFIRLCGERSYVLPGL
jgi:hypothetical protein